MNTSNKPDRQVVANAMSKTPRFLFRAWNALSGGDPALNTKDAITPLAFHRRVLTSSSFYDQDCQELWDRANDHLCMKIDSSKPTYYCSWSHSLPFVVLLANEKNRNRDKSKDSKVYISVIDTAALDDSVVVLHTKDFGKITGRPPFNNYAHELLAFGTIRTHVTASLDDLNDQGLSLLISNSGSAWQYSGRDYDQSTDNIQTLIDVSQTVSELFNTEQHPIDYEIAIQAHLLAPFSKEHHDRIISALCSRSFPPVKWQHDPKFFSDDVDVHGHIEARRATVIIRDMLTVGMSEAQQLSTPASRRDMEAVERKKREVTPDTTIVKQLSQDGARSFKLTSGWSSEEEEMDRATASAEPKTVDQIAESERVAGLLRERDSQSKKAPWL